jgi:NAD(P)-dependent dehydrogenase (short-subunit alcohol dehydrogenase family)
MLYPRATLVITAIINTLYNRKHIQMNSTAVPNRFEDAVVIVTGSTRGIGREIARRFAAEGASVVVTGRSVNAGEEIVSEFKNSGYTATFVSGDLRDIADIETVIQSAVDAFGQLDVLVNNAGVQTETTITEATLSDWNRVVETDFRSFWLCAKEAVNSMSNGGNILNISSNHAFLTMPGLFPYNAVKAGINGMTRAMALDLGPKIRVNTINPGWIAIERTLSELDDDYREYLEGIHPVGRLGTPSDIAGVAAFLASDDAEFITGTSVTVDGGRSAVMQDDTLPDYS